MSEEDKVSTVHIKSSLAARLWAVIVGARWKVVIAHRGTIDKIVVYLNDEEIGALR